MSDATFYKVMWAIMVVFVFVMLSAGIASTHGDQIINDDGRYVNLCGDSQSHQGNFGSDCFWYRVGERVDIVTRVEVTP